MPDQPQWALDAYAGGGFVGYLEELRLRSLPVSAPPAVPVLPPTEAEFLHLTGGVAHETDEDVRVRELRGVVDVVAALPVATPAPDPQLVPQSSLEVNPWPDPAPVPGPIVPLTKPVDAPEAEGPLDTVLAVADFFTGGMVSQVGAAVKVGATGWDVLSGLVGGFTDDYSVPYAEPPDLISMQGGSPVGGPGGFVEDVLVPLDIRVNEMTGGAQGETISARVGRRENPLAAVVAGGLDTIDPGHTERAVAGVLPRRWPGVPECVQRLIVEGCRRGRMPR